MTTQECAAWLQIDEDEVRRMIGQGMPAGAGDTLDAAAVAAWLDEQGLADVDAGTVATQAEVAAHFGVSIHTVKDWRADGMPGEPGAWDLSAIARWKRGRTKDPERDPLLTGDTSPALERYRQARAQIAELELGLKRGELIRRDHNREFLGRLAAILRQAGDALRPMPEAHQVLDEALRDLDTEIEAFFNESSNR